jgi:serine/threonine protein kinase
MGAVYKAWDLNLARPVALKVMHQQFANQPEFQQRFMQEAQAAARLDHPSIVKVHNFGARPGFFYMVMEFVAGNSLNAYLKKLRQMNQVIKLNETLAVLAQVADALGFAHRQGVVHRDVKPDNVLLKPLDNPDRDGDPPIRAIVTDFGLAKLIEGGVQTQTGTFMGTLPYMSPEQCLGKDLDGRSDIYSLGVMLYQLTTGRLPFDIRTPTEAVVKHIHEAPPPPRSVRPGLSAAIESVINKAIAKDAAARYQTGEEMARALRQAAGGLTDADVTKFAPPESVVSLVTQLMPNVSIAEPSRLGQDLTALPGVDRIVISRQGEAPRAFHLEKEKVLIGRSSDNDIALSAEGVSRVHARIERNPGPHGGWRVVDMGSTNGSFLDNTKLLPDIPEPWQPTQTLRIGAYFLRLQPTQTAPVTALGVGPTAATPSYQATRRGRTVVGIGATQVHSSSGQLSVTITPTNVDVAPGGRADVQVQLLNQGMTVDHFRLEVEGLPPDWVTLHQKSIQLMPGSEGFMTLTIHPPQASDAPAGAHPYRLLVHSATNPNESASIAGQVIIKGFERFRVDMRPARLRHGQTTRVLVINESNAEMNFTILGRDPAEAIEFEGQRGRMKLEPGQKGTQDLVLTAKNRPFMGSASNLPFEVQVTAPSGSRQTVPGQLEVPARLPAWVLPLLIGLSVLVCLSLVGVFGFVRNRNAQATQTAEALAAGVVNAQATQTAMALGTAAAGQAAAGTATSLAQTAVAEGDNDNDGLSNNQETTNTGTDPNNADTDGDGLSDGVEVNQHGTNPKQQDSDGDTLPDGVEVNEHRTSPTNPDTDGDTVPDGVEVNVGSDPLLPPTATATPTATTNPTPTPTNAPTATPTLPPTATPTTPASPTPTTAPTATPTVFIVFPIYQLWLHDLSVSESRQVYHLRMTAPGTIAAHVEWTGTQSDLAVIINGPGQVGYYARVDGSSPIDVSYTVTDADFATGNDWRVSIVSFGSGRADGTIDLTYPSGSTAVPILTTDFVVDTGYGNSTSLVRLINPGTISGEATWSGAPGNMALIINGPGQVGYYARQDGASPLEVSYTVTEADLAFGDIWRVSVAAFSAPSATGSVSLSFP